MRAWLLLLAPATAFADDIEMEPVRARVAAADPSSATSVDASVEAPAKKRTWIAPHIAIAGGVHVQSFNQPPDIDTGTQNMPPGEVGELIIRGPQVMLGYWNKPEETAKVIRDGWLFTGDLATCDEDGFFRIVDRKKDLIITGGFNVYPADVEVSISNGEIRLGGLWRSDFAVAINVSVANDGAVAVAAADTSKVGIEIEALVHWEAAWEARSFQPHEREIVAATMDVDRDEWLSRSWCATTFTSGLSALIAIRADSTFFSPTRSVVWMIWRWRLDRSTMSKSTSPMVPTPAAARYTDEGAPSPPAPMSSTRDLRSLICPASPTSGSIVCRE